MNITNFSDLDKFLIDFLSKKSQEIELDKITIEEKVKKIKELQTGSLLLAKSVEKINTLIYNEKKKLEDYLSKEEEKIIKIKELLTENNETKKLDNYFRPKTISGKKLVNIEIGPGCYLPAIRIDKPEESHNFRGWWCWEPNMERFYISINDEIISGTTTIINSAEQIPIKFFEHKDCENNKYCSIDYKLTNFYIPRESNPQSRDVRQFTNRMKFIPASQELKKNDKYVYRLGSKDTLKKDLINLRLEDYRVFQDLTVNFLLILTLASHEIRKK